MKCARMKNRKFYYSVIIISKALNCYPIGFISY
jgi:hypothetical protein